MKNIIILFVILFFQVIPAITHASEEDLFLICNGDRFIEKNKELIPYEQKITKSFEIKKKELVVDIFRGNNNEQDILNTQLAVLNKLVQVLRGGDLHQDLYQLDGSPSFEPFYDRFENEMAGWALTFDVIIPNDISIC